MFCASACPAHVAARYARARFAAGIVTPCSLSPDAELFIADMVQFEIDEYNRFNICARHSRRDSYFAEKLEALLFASFHSAGRYTLMAHAVFAKHVVGVLRQE